MPHYSQPYVMELAQSLQDDVWTATHAKWKDNDLYYDLAWKVEAPGTAQIVHPQKARATINHASDQLITLEPTVSRRPLGKGKEDQELADKLEPWGALVLQRVQRTGIAPPFRSHGKNLMLYGYTASYGPIWPDTEWPMHVERGQRRRTSAAYRRELEARARETHNWSPFSLDVPHPSKFLMDPMGGKQPSFGILRVQRYLKDVMEEYPEAKLTGRPFSLVTQFVYFSEEQRMVWVTQAAVVDRPTEGVVVADGENEYGFVPFLQAYSGFGMDSGSGDAKEAVKRLAVGLLDYSKDSLEGGAVVATAITHHIRTLGFLHTFTSENATELANEMARSTVVQVQREGVWKEEMPSVPPWVLEWYLKTEQDIDMGTYGEILAGQRPAGVTTASQHAQLTAKAKLVFVVPLMQLNDMASLYLGNCGRLLKAYQDSVTLEGMLGKKRQEVTVGWEDFQDNYQFDVNFAGLDPMERAAKLEMGLALRAAAGPDGRPGTGISWQTLVEDYAQLSDVSEERKRLDREFGMAAPLLQQAILAEVERQWRENYPGLVPPADGTPGPGA